jgi:hypothetical protein
VAGRRSTRGLRGDWIALDPATIREFSVRSAPDGTVLIFGLAAPIRPGRLPAFVPNEETSELAVITQAYRWRFHCIQLLPPTTFRVTGGRNMNIRPATPADAQHWRWCI